MRERLGTHLEAEANTGCAVCVCTLSMLARDRFRQSLGSAVPALHATIWVPSFACHGHALSCHLD